MPTTRLIDIQKNQNYLEPVYKHLRIISKTFQKDISSRTGDIPLSNFGKEVSKLTDWQAYMKFRIIWNKCINIAGMPPKNFRKISHPELEISLYLSSFSKKVSQLTDWHIQKIHNNLKIVQKYPGNISKNFRNKFYPQLQISLCWHNFSKEVS